MIIYFFLLLTLVHLGYLWQTARGLDELALINQDQAGIAAWCGDVTLGGVLL